MSLGLVGRKVGMTRVFTDEGDSVPVTVVDVSDNRVTQIKSAQADGYVAVQVTFGKRRPSRVSKSAAGHFAKAAVEAGHTLKEFRVNEEQLANLKVGGKVGVDLFQVGQMVDVTGTSQGKGFSGARSRAARAAICWCTRLPRRARKSLLPRRPREVRNNGSETDRRQRPVRLDHGRLRRAVRPRLQRTADPSGGDCLSGQRTPGHARAEGAQRDRQIHAQAMAPERHRPRPRRYGLEPAVARWRQDFPVEPGREFHAEAE